MTGSVALGAADDEGLFGALGDVLAECGATLVRDCWALAGDEEIYRWSFALGGDALEVIAEPERGLRLEGPEALVEDIAAELKRRIP